MGSARGSLSTVGSAASEAHVADAAAPAPAPASGLHKVPSLRVVTASPLIKSATHGTGTGSRTHTPRGGASAPFAALGGCGVSHSRSGSARSSRTNLGAAVPGSSARSAATGPRPARYLGTLDVHAGAVLGLVCVGPHIASVSTDESVVVRQVLDPQHYTPMSGLAFDVEDEAVDEEVDYEDALVLDETVAAIGAGELEGAFSVGLDLSVPLPPKDTHGTSGGSGRPAGGFTVPTATSSAATPMTIMGLIRTMHPQPQPLSHTHSPVIPTVAAAKAALPFSAPTGSTGITRVPSVPSSLSATRPTPAPLHTAAKPPTPIKTQPATSPSPSAPIPSHVPWPFAMEPDAVLTAFRGSGFAPGPTVLSMATTRPPLTPDCRPGLGSSIRGGSHSFLSSPLAASASSVSNPPATRAAGGPCAVTVPPIQIVRATWQQGNSFLEHFNGLLQVEGGSRF